MICGEREGRGIKKNRTLAGLIFFMLHHNTFYILYNYYPYQYYIDWQFERRTRTRRGRNCASTLIIGQENPSVPWQRNFLSDFYHAHTHTHALFLESTSKLETHDDVLFAPTCLDDDASPSVTKRTINVLLVVF